MKTAKDIYALIDGILADGAAIGVTQSRLKTLIANDWGEVWALLEALCLVAISQHQTIEALKVKEKSQCS